METNKRISYGFIRNKLKKVVMGNMGKVSENEEYLTCTVNNKNKFDEEELGYRKYFNYNSDLVEKVSFVFNLSKQKNI